MEALKQAFEEEYGKIEAWSDEIVEAYKLALAMCLGECIQEKGDGGKGVSDERGNHLQRAYRNHT